MDGFGYGYWMPFVASQNTRTHSSSTAHRHTQKRQQDKTFSLSCDLLRRLSWPPPNFRRRRHKNRPEKIAFFLFTFGALCRLRCSTSLSLIFGCELYGYGVDWGVICFWELPKLFYIVYSFALTATHWHWLCFLWYVVMCCVSNQRSLWFRLPCLHNHNSFGWCVRDGNDSFVRPLPFSTRIQIRIVTIVVIYK